MDGQCLVICFSPMIVIGLSKHVDVEGFDARQRKAVGDGMKH